MMDELLRSLPACRRCRQNRRRCDTHLPSCQNCSKAGTECIFFDHVLRENLPRSYIASLLHRLKEIRGPAIPSPENAVLQPEATGGLLVHHKGASRYIGKHSCLSQSYPVHDSGLNTRPVQLVPNPPILEVGRGITVTREIHQYLLKTYFTEIHPLYPFLDESQPFLLPDGPPATELAPWQKFILELVYSIACHCTNQDGYRMLADECHQRALLSIDVATADITITTLQAITLLALHSFFDPQKGNFGQLIGFAARLAIDIERHDTPDQETRMQRIYSSIYCMENHFATALDRPSFLPEPARPLQFDTNHPEDLLCSLYRIQSRFRNNPNRDIISPLNQRLQIESLEWQVEAHGSLSPNILAAAYETQLLIEPKAATAACLLATYIRPRYIHTFLTPQWAYRAGIILMSENSSHPPDVSFVDAYGNCMLVLEQASRRWPSASVLKQSIQSLFRSKEGNNGAVSVVPPLTS